MHKILLLLFVALPLTIIAQTKDSTNTLHSFSGSIGITNNGFSIVPTFSLNSPASIINVSLRRNKFSIDPDIRLVTNGSKGGMVFWFRYRLIENKKFNLRVGTHPAFSYVRRLAPINNKETEITEMMRFAAIEVAPNYQISPNLGLGLYFLKGHGFQKHGPQNTNVLFLNAPITNLKLSQNMRFSVIPSVYFLDIDETAGKYFTGTAILSNTKTPFSIQSSINKTFTSNVAGNRDFMWNVMLVYNFRKTYRLIK